MDGRRVVVTGMGVVSPIGIGAGAFRAALGSGACGVAPIAAFDATALPIRVAAEVRDFDDGRVPSDPRFERVLSRSMRLGLVAAAECLESAGVGPDGPSGAGVACFMAVGRHDIDIVDFGNSYGRGFDESNTFDLERYYAKGARALHPLRLLTFVPNIAVTITANTFGLSGEANAYTAEGAACLQALGDAADLIREGAFDAALCGGCDSRFDGLGLARYMLLGLLAETSPEDLTVSAPYDRARRGFVPGEGAAFFFVEALERAEARGARPLAEIAGWGSGSDAYHPVRVHPRGVGLERAMRSAIASAGHGPADVDLVVAAAAAMPDLDAAEGAALAEVFDETRPFVTAPAGALGRTGSAAGAFNAATAILAIGTGEIPPTVSTVDPDDCAPPGLVLGATAHRADVGLAVANGYTIGGLAASVVFREVGR